MLVSLAGFISQSEIKADNHVWQFGSHSMLALDDNPAYDEAASSRCSPVAYHILYPFGFLINSCDGMTISHILTFLFSPSNTHIVKWFQ